jgi:hypothetical protein
MANLIETAAHDKRLTTFVAALRYTSLVDVLQGPSPSPSSRQPTTPSTTCLPAP